MPFPVDERYVQAAEQELGHRLPETLRSRLRVNNGGEVTDGEEDWQLHPVWDSSSRERSRRSANHIVRETHQARTWRGFPQADSARRVPPIEKRPPVSGFSARPRGHFF